MFVCARVYVRVCIHACSFYMCVHMLTDMGVFMRTRICSYVHIYVSSCVCVHEYVCVSVCMNMFTYVYLCSCV